MKELLHQGQGQFPLEELESISDQAIDDIRRNAILEPENQEKLRLVQGPKKGITDLFSA
jgi:hypothetical protein